MRGEDGGGRGRLQQDGGLLQAQRILLFDFSLKPVHLVHVYTLMVACRVCEQEREREREIPVITRDTHKHNMKYNVCTYTIKGAIYAHMTRIM